MARRHLSEKITYRLSPEDFHRLENLGKTFNLNAHGMARKLMQEGLERAGDSTELDHLREEMHDLHAEQVAQSQATLQQMGHLRIDLATAVEALLSYVSEESPEEIRAWVTETLLAQDVPFMNEEE